MYVQVWAYVTGTLDRQPDISSMPRISSDPWEALSAWLHCCPASSPFPFSPLPTPGFTQSPRPSQCFTPSTSPSILLLPLYLRALPPPHPQICPFKQPSYSPLLCWWLHPCRFHRIIQHSPFPRPPFKEASPFILPPFTPPLHPSLLFASELRVRFSTLLPFPN